MDLRVVTWNMRLGTDPEWEARAIGLARHVAAEGAHLLALQEAMSHQIAAISWSLPHLRAVPGAATHDGEHNAIFYDPRLLRLVDEGTFWLSDTPHLESASWGNLLPRAAHWARFAPLRGGSAFTVADVHLDHESQRFREKAATLLSETLRDALILGDFNAEPGSRTYRTLTRHHIDAIPREGMETMPASGRGEVRYDWILAPGSWKALAPARLTPVPEVSDHRGLAATLRLDERARE